MNGQWTDDHLSSFILFSSSSKEIVSSVSVSHPLSDELYYKLCKQSVDMCCCLATLGDESNRISVRLCLCVSARMRDLIREMWHYGLWGLRMRTYVTYMYETCAHVDLYKWGCISEVMGICICVVCMDRKMRSVPWQLCLVLFCFLDFCCLSAPCSCAPSQPDFPSTPALH